MIALIQRVTRAEVVVDGATMGAIDHGILALIGIERTDTMVQVERLLERLWGYRIFADAQGKMNLSLREVNGGLLLVPQFTLVADTDQGMRPSFTAAAPAEQGRILFDALVTRAQVHLPRSASGCFGAHMAVSLVNDGPVTFWLRA